MLDQLIKLVQQNGGDAILNNPAIPAQEKNAAIQEVAQQISGGLQNQVNQGNLQDLMSMFSGGSSSGLTSNPVIGQLISSVSSSLASKFGISPQISEQIASNVLPQIMNQFVNKTNDPNDRDFDLQDMLKNFTGKSDVSDIMGKFTGSQAGQSGIGNVIGKIFG